MLRQRTWRKRRPVANAACGPSVSHTPTPATTTAATKSAGGPKGATPNIANSHAT